MNYFIRTFGIWKNNISTKFHKIFVKEYRKLSRWELVFGDPLEKSIIAVTRITHDKFIRNFGDYNYTTPTVVNVRSGHGFGDHQSQAALRAASTWMGGRLSVHWLTHLSLSGKGQFFWFLDGWHWGSRKIHGRLHRHEFSAVSPCPRQMRCSVAKSSADAPAVRYTERISWQFLPHLVW